MNCASNIITANFSGGKTHATTARVYQWSRGIELCITGADDLPQTFKAHFSVQKRGGVATTIVGIDERVDVPNVLFTIGKDIHVWLGASETENDAEILYTVDIPVAPAPMPEYYDAEDTGVFDAVVEQVADYAATATAAANSAGASATAAAGSASAAAASASSAAESAGAAEQARADAVTAKGQAETAAQTATEKAQQSAQNAEQAASDAGRAESAAGRAELAETGAGAAKTAAEAAAQSAAASAATANEKATLAGQSATAAAGSASAAAQSAASIEGDVQIASQKASEAQTAAGQAVTAKDAAVTARQGAETAATNAGQSASTATTKAAEAAQSASGAAQSKTDAEAAAARAEQAAATLTVDTALSDTSTNPVQNKVITGELTDVKSAIDNLYIPLELVQTYDGKILRKTGLQDNANFCTYQYAIPDDIESVHIKSNFYGNTFIIFTDMATDGDFSASPYQQYPSSGYNTPTTVDDYYDSKGFRYVWIPLYKPSGVKTTAAYSAFELIDNNKQGIDVLNAKAEENKSDIVELQADVNELNGVMRYPGSFDMEIGNISLYGYGYNDLHYTTSAVRVRTLQGENIHLEPGYKVTLSDYTAHRFYLYQIVSAELVRGLGWKQADFEITDEADYAILISAVPEATVQNVADLASLMTIYLPKEEDEEDGSGIPSYWDDEINASITSIRNNELSAGNRIFEFMFLTDTHWNHNAKVSAAIIEFLSDKFHINQIFGGDVITSHYEDKSQAIAEVRSFYDAFSKPLPTVLGNHDFNAANDTTQRLTMPECYALMLRQQEEVLGMNTFASPYYWTLDNESQKVRIIGFRCDGINAVSSDITNKVKDLISTLSADWNIVLLTHGFWAVTEAGEPISIATPVQAVIDAIMPTIESASASVPLWVVGHSHRDQSQVITGTSKNILVLGCNCDAYAESAVWGGETMTPGTATEQAITCIQLDMTNKKVHAVRIGAGSDRTFSY